MTTQQNSQQSLVEQPEYNIRYSGFHDESFLFDALFDPGTREWYPPSSDSDVYEFTRNWIGFVRYRSSLTATFQEKPIGIATIFLMPYVKVAHLAMGYLVVDRNFRRKGVGSSLYKNMKNLAKKNFPRIESIHFEIFEGSAITHLLLKDGAKFIFQQDKFVKLPNGYKARLIYEKQL